jgi:O-methyltransferase
VPDPSAAEFKKFSLFGQLRRELDKGRRKLFAPRGVKELPPEFPADFSDFTRDLCRRVAPYTMTSKARVAAIERAVRYVVANGIDGDFAECGVAGGGSVMAMAWCLIELGETGRTLWLYDTFAGMPEPTENDVGRYGSSAMKRYRQRRKDGQSTWINIALDTVKANVAGTGYPPANLRFVEGKVEETLPRTRPERIAFLRLDTDWYESTKAELEHLFPLVEPGGVILLDDYFAWAGHRKAVDDYVAANGIRIFWARIDDHAVVGIKQ